MRYLNKSAVINDTKLNLTIYKCLWTVCSLLGRCTLWEDWAGHTVVICYHQHSYEAFSTSHPIWPKVTFAGYINSLVIAIVFSQYRNTAITKYTIVISWCKELLWGITMTCSTWSIRACMYLVVVVYHVLCCDDTVLVAKEQHTTLWGRRTTRYLSSGKY